MKEIKKETLEEFISKMNNTQNELFEDQSKEHATTAEKARDLYLATAYTLIIGILKLQAKDIPEDYLFEYVKQVMPENSYKALYHIFVLKDSVDGMETDIPLEPDLDTLHLKEE